MYWALLLLVATTYANPFKPVFSWNKFDYNFPNESSRSDALQSGRWIQQHTVPLGFNIWGDKMFFTIPRFRNGVLTTLNYINLNKTTSDTVGFLNPYPNWESNDVTKSNAFVSFFRMRIDACGRLWGLDNGIDDLIGNPKKLGPMRLIAINLKTDKVIPGTFHDLDH